MSSAARQTRRPSTVDQPSLINGDRMQQAEFHCNYQAYPDKSKFELIAGTVFMASPLRWPHAKFHSLLVWLFETYAETPGVECLDNVTTILDEENEPQPDVVLRLATEFGGASSITRDGYLQGAPELIGEIAHSTRAIDLHQKKEAYRKAGVQEYLVLAIEQREITWFDFRSRRILKPDQAGVCRSRIFPGLWLSIPGLVNQRKSEMKAVLNAGVQSPEHIAFVKRLQARKRPQS